MSDIVTGTPAVVGFTNGHHGHYNHGISDKDQQFASSIDNGEQTRDLLEAIAATSIAVEKTGAANSLATEKIGAAGVLESAKNAAALNVQLAASSAALAQQAAANQQAAMMYANSNASAGVLLATQNQAALAAQIAECCCETKELIRSIDAQRIRDELALLQTQFMMVTGGLTPAGGRGRIGS